MASKSIICAVTIPSRYCIKDSYWVKYGGWFGMLLCFVLSQATERQNVKWRVVRLSSCRLVANDAHQTARSRDAWCRDVTLSLGSIRRIGLWAKQQGDIATKHHTTTRRLACFAWDRTTRQKGDNDIGCVVAIDNATRKVYQISHHSWMLAF
jgi:hypothetical protein